MCILVIKVGIHLILNQRYAPSSVMVKMSSAIVFGMMIRNRDVIFNEKVIYKDRHKTDTSDLEQGGPVFAEAYDIPNDTPTK